MTKIWNNIRQRKNFTNSHKEKTVIIMMIMSRGFINMIEIKKNVEIFRESELVKIVINKKGQILGTSHSFQKLFCCKVPHHISDLYEQDLYYKVKSLLERPHNPN